MIFVDYTSGSTLDVGEHPSVDHYLSAIRGRVFTYGEDDRKRTSGRVRAWKLHLDLMERDGQDPWEVMDAEDEELEALYSAVFDVQVGQFKPAVLRAARLEEPPSHILAIYTVELKKAFRGRRLSLPLIARIMDDFGGADGIAALYPYPLGMRGEGGHLVKRAQRRLSLYWQSAGFKPIPGSDWLVSNGRSPARWGSIGSAA